MMDHVQWQESNTQYLAAALHWLRLRLQKLAGNEEATTEVIAQAEILMLSAAEMEPPPALLMLREMFGMTQFEQDVLFLCAAMELDTRISGFCNQIQDDRNCPYPTFALALSLFDNPVRNVISPERPLRYWRLLEIHQSGVQPLITSPLRIDERIVNYIQGMNYLDDRLQSLLVPLAARDASASKEIPLPPSQQAIVDTILEQLNAVGSSQWFPIIQVVGPDVASKQMVAQQVTRTWQMPLYRMLVELLPNHAADLETLTRLWQRESRMMPVALYLDIQALGGGAPKDETLAALRQFLGSCDGLFFLDVREQGLAIDQEMLTVEVAKPTALEQRQAWSEALGIDAQESPALLSNQFSLNLGEIWSIAQSVLVQKIEKKDSETPLKLWNACLVRTRPRLDTLAQRLDAKAQWEDIVLPSEELGMLHQIAAQVRHRSTVYDDWGFRRRMNRGLGVSVLFAGESGTGKTMAAEVIANELRLNLYRIDLSTVVSKYIGETEKNLHKLFDAAEDGGAILFFDEADSLFGKRSEVKDSHDRYANIEVNYLLQRIESFGGLAILATNLKSSIDLAFLRRLRFVINFPFPSVESQKQLWQKIFPPKTPIMELDYEHLGKLNLTGGSIHSIAVNAAFLAVQNQEKVEISHILTIARKEFRKLERSIYEGDFKIFDNNSIT
jgi:ATPase family associated with various cellular activities (AAA)